MFVKKLVTQAVCNPDDPVAVTPKGRLRGVRVDGTYIFRGIRYATAKRFHEPEPVPAWEGVKEAIIYGPVCPEINTVQPNDNYTVPHVFYPQDEDCLYLNLWTQRINDENAKRPVLVWLHGGGYATGSSIEHFAYDGENMSRFGDVVVVTVNHRLNILGYFDLSKYGKEYENSANAGLLDLVEALKWVRDNIASFGGDPNNVTIFGQSGGGDKVATLLQCPPADGLFHRAVIESGVIKGSMASLAGGDAPDLAEVLMDKLGITPDRVKELETVPYYQFQKILAPMGWGPVMALSPKADGKIFLGSIFQVPVSEHAKTVPVMVGNVLAEGNNNFYSTIDDNRRHTWSEEKREAVIRSKLGDLTDRAIAAQKKAYPGKNIANLLFTDYRTRPASVDYAVVRAEQGAVNTYNFLFCLEANFYGGVLPWHNAEIPYVFHNADYIEPSYIPGVTEKLQDIVCGAWCRFAETGDPNGAFGLPDWHPVTPENHYTMLFDEETREALNHDKELTDVLQEANVRLDQIRRQKVAKYFGGGPRV